MTDSSTYHHGDLRRALLVAALQALRQGGVEAVSIRGLAQTVGVSPAAPFRHFANKKALLTAMAEEIMSDFAREMETALVAAPAGQALRALGIAYLRWALGHRAEFALISDRDAVDFAQSEPLLALSEGVMRRLDPLIEKRLGAHDDQALAEARLVFRGIVYGLARMAVDRHLEEWNVSAEAQLETVERVLDRFLSMLAP